MSSTLIITTFACAFPAPEPSEVQKDQANLAGDWQIVRVDGQRKAQWPKEWPLPKVLIIRDIRMTPFFQTNNQAVFVLDPAQTPRQMDVIIDQNLPYMKWIYGFDGDQLKLGMTFDLTLPGGEAGQTRPKSFLVDADPSVIVFVYQRVKK